ncbi:hypothetical protein SN15_01975 [Stenotrophomonas maltophilia]|nr:hypothetical protein SN15_01975 [Stenotrophomonas maltophilia]
MTACGLKVLTCGALALYLAGCATYQGVQEGAPRWSGKTSAKPVAYVSCVAPKLQQTWRSIQILPDGSDQSVMLTDGFGGIHGVVKARADGVVTLHGPRGTADTIPDLEACL